MVYSGMGILNRCHKALVRLLRSCASQVRNLNHGTGAGIAGIIIIIYIYIYIYMYISGEPPSSPSRASSDPGGELGEHTSDPDRRPTPLHQHQTPPRYIYRTEMNPGKHPDTRIKNYL